jgi:predicted dinucleotide-binding enzyme
LMLSNSRGPDALAEVGVSIEGSVRAELVADVARFGEVVAVAIPPRGGPGASARALRAGKIVVDANRQLPTAGGSAWRLRPRPLPIQQELAASGRCRVTCVG